MAEKAKEATVQFRKTKADQEAFGTCKTLLKTGVKKVCVVTALEELREAAPRRFGNDQSAIYYYSDGFLNKF